MDRPYVRCVCPERALFIYGWNFRCSPLHLQVAILGRNAQRRASIQVHDVHVDARHHVQQHLDHRNVASETRFNERLTPDAFIAAPTVAVFAPHSLMPSLACRAPIVYSD